MFSLSGSTPRRLRRCAATHHVYVPPDGRINLAGISDSNVDRVADSIVAACSTGPDARRGAAD